MSNVKTRKVWTFEVTIDTEWLGDEYGETLEFADVVTATSDVARASKS